MDYVESIPFCKKPSAARCLQSLLSLLFQVQFTRRVAKGSRDIEDIEL